jgi:hypothetical protein
MFLNKNCMRKGAGSAPNNAASSFSQENHCTLAQCTIYVGYHHININNIKV